MSASGKSVQQSTSGASPASALPQNDLQTKSISSPCTKSKAINVTPKGKPVGFATWGSIKLPIYYCPVKGTIKSQRDPGTATGSEVVSEAITKVYDSFLIGYYENGRWRSARGATLEKAKIKGKLIAQRLAENGSKLLQLSQGDCRIYLQAQEILKKHGLTVDAAARMLDELLGRLKAGTLPQAVDFFNIFGAQVIPGTFPQTYEIYLEDLTRKGVGVHHLRDVKKFVGAFVESFPVEVSTVRTQDIDRHLSSIGGKARNKNNGRDKIIAYFNFLQNKDYLPKGIVHAAKTSTVFTDARVVITSEEQAAATASQTDIYSAAQMRKILAVASEEERVTLELKAFSGIRTEELSRLWWVLIDEESDKISITKAISKIGQRVVPILPNLKVRLAKYPASLKRDKVSKLWTLSNSLYHVWKRLADEAGVPYKRNAFRNSYISYRLAQTKDIKLVAHESGNSPEMIQKYYLDIATEDEANAWFAL